MADEDVPRSAELEVLLDRARKASPPRARLDAVRARLEAELGLLGPPPEPPARSAPPARQTPSWLAPAGAVVVLALALVAIVARQPAPEESGEVESHGSSTEQSVSHDPSPEASPSELTAPELTAPELTAPEVQRPRSQRRRSPRRPSPTARASQRASARRPRPSAPRATVSRSSATDRATRPPTRRRAPRSCVKRSRSSSAR